MSIKEIGNAIKERRNALNIRQPDLAELAQVSLNTVYRLERGMGNPSLDVLQKMADVLGMELLMTVRQQHS
ncbi:MAG: transcriptional regulator [Citrobacter freundii]|nr:MAG: transcriptional regulator [Citrobacter freundii]